VDSTTSNDTDTKKILYAFSIFFWCAAVVSLIVLCMVYHKINLAIAVLKAGADYMKQTPQVLLVPIIILVILTAFLAYWFAAFM
jgi:hypothetical protein